MDDEKEEDVEQVGWKVPVKILDDFRSLCDRYQWRYAGTLAAAMIVWKHLPAEIQKQALGEVDGVNELDLAFWEALNQGLHEAITKQVYEIKKR